VQEGNVYEYVVKIKERKYLMHALNFSSPEFYYISSFVSGLKEDIKPMLKILKLMVLIIAFEQAK